MIHASKELIEAVGSVSPSWTNPATEALDPQPGAPYRLAACGSRDASLSNIAWVAVVDPFHNPMRGFCVREPDGAVNCPTCLALLRSAIGPARIAELEVEADRLHGVISAWQQAEAEAPTCRRCGGRFLPGRAAIECEQCHEPSWFLVDGDFAALGRAVDLRYPAQSAQKWLTAFRALVPATVGEATSSPRTPSPRQQRTPR